MTPAKIVIGIGLAGAIFIAGYMANGHHGAAPAAAATHVQYACPMHPQYRSERAGDCPSCGMRLEPLSGGAVNGASTSSANPGLVKITPAQQQLIGVRTDVVQKTSNASVLRVSGRIAADDSRVYRLVAATDGWVRDLGRNPAGALVKRNEVLASYFVRDLVSAQQNYLYSFTTATQANQPNVVPQRNSAALNLRLALDALRSLGMTDAEIEELQRKGQPSAEMHLYSPAAGLVLQRGISPGQRFDKGTELYRIADLSHLWVMADVFEKDREFLKPGAEATVRYRGREFRATMSDLLPQFDAESRNLKTRFELDNPGYALRPDMYVDIELHVGLPSGISAPADAVIDTGRRKTVYVDRGNGYFEPRVVNTGWRLGDRVQVTQGLEPGERIVVSGNFLIDSESRMKGMTGPGTTVGAAKSEHSKDPVCGMEVDTKAPDAIRLQHGRKVYIFCSTKCRRDFESSSEKYVDGGARGME